MRALSAAAALAATLLPLAASALAADLPANHPAVAGVSAADLQFFESRIRPILADHCYKCHSRQSDKVRGGLLLDSREATLLGGNTGPALVPGKPDQSLLIQAVRYKDEDLQMPPKGEKLSDAQIADLVEWVRRGAPDPRVVVAKGGKTGGSGRNHWAFQPRTSPPTRRRSCGGFTSTSSACPRTRSTCRTS
jgi:mono/diheme cytochrome c family protein